MRWTRASSRGWAWTPHAILGASVSVTLGFAYLAWSLVEARAQQRFSAIVRNTQGRIEGRVDTHIGVLEAIAADFSVDEYVTRDEFHGFVQALDLSRRYPEVRRFGFSRRFDDSGEAEIVREIHELHGEATRLWPANAGPERHAVVYLEPHGPLDDASFGFDLSTDPTLREAMERARDSGTAVASGRVSIPGLTGADGDEPEFLLLAPVYRDGLPRTDVASRREAIVGYNFLEFRCRDLLAPIVARPDFSDVFVELYAGSSATPADLLYTNRPSDAGRDARFSTTNTFALAGHSWTLAAATRPGSDADSLGDEALVVLAIGLVVSGALFVAARSGYRTRALSERAATQRRRSEQELSRRDQQFREMAETIEDVFWVSDATLRSLVYVSPSFARVFHAPDEPLAEVSAHWARRLHPDDRDRVRRASASQEGDATYDETYRIVLDDGSIRWIHDRAFPIRDATGRLVRTIGISSDVTRVKDAELALRQNEEQFREITENITEVVWVTSADAITLLYVSPSYEHVWGRSRAPLFVDPLAWIAAIHEDDRARVVAALPRALDGTYAVNYRINRPDGTVRWIRDHAAPVRDASGAVVRVVGTASDVTDLHEAKEALLRNAEHLRQAQKMEAVGRLAGGIAHDFNNLLTVILGFGDLARSASSMDPMLRSQIDQMIGAGERASVLTRQLLAFSRKQLLKPEPLDLNAVIRAAHALLVRVIGEDVELTLDLDPKPGTVLADQGQVDQVLMNLVVNSRDAMPTGGRITLRTRNVELDAAYVALEPGLKAGRYLAVSVTDTGTGMTAETQARIFEPFFTTKPEGEGTGLGLATVYGIVKQSQGHVSVASEVGCGTTFTIHLPRVDLPRRRATGVGQKSLLPGGTETLLLVEDESAVKELAEMLLTRQGYRVLAASSGAEALEIATATQGPIDLLLTDVVMPAMNGRQLSERMREIHPETRVLFMSGYTDDIIAHHGVLADGIELIEKPYTRESLLRRVRAVLDAARQTSADCPI